MGIPKVYSFHMTLSYSRDPFCCFTTSQDLQTFFDCHRRAFAHFGGYVGDNSSAISCSRSGWSLPSRSSDGLAAAVGTARRRCGNPAASLGHALVDDYLQFVAARCRPNTLLATAYDLNVFFSLVPKEPVDVVTADIFAFITAQKKPRRGPKVVRLEDGEAGLSARTIKRRLASISGLFGYLMTRDDLAIDRNPVPTGLANRRRSGNRGAPLLRTPRTLPRVLGPGEVEAVLGAVNTARDRAMILAMLLGGLRRCEVLGLKLGDLSPGERRVSSARARAGTSA